MGVIAKKGANFEVCPTGSHIAVCCDVIDMGIVDSTYSGKTKKQHKIRIAWQLSEYRDDGKPFLVQKRYTNSLHEKASLRKELESWRGRAFTDDELNGFDLDNLIGVPCMISVVHAAVSGSIYANVSAIMRLPKGVPAPVVDPAYIRVQDRPKNGDSAQGSGPDLAEWGEPSDEDIPF